MANIAERKQSVHRRSRQQHSSALSLRPDVFSRLARLSVTARIPGSTYRLQFNAHFTFRDARRLVPYLSDLGITDCYASPYLKACPQSTHGYDICDHNALNPAIGTEREYDDFVAALHGHDMGQIMDVVPNHMGIGSPANAAWMDVLENGPSSPYARLFDIDWHPLMAGVQLENRILLPILGDQYGKVLENGELCLSQEDGAFFVYYYDTKLPIDPATLADLLSLPLGGLGSELGSDNDSFHEYQSIITALGHLPSRSETDPDQAAERQREKEVVKRRLSNLYHSCLPVKSAVDYAVVVYNGTPNQPSSFDRLDTLLDAQAYRLAYWRVAAEEINYRRFFDVNDLAALRMEDPKIFQETHQLILRLLAEGKVTGLRIDHPDGLWDPAGYLRQLQRSYLFHNYRKELLLRNESTDEERLALERVFAADVDDLHPSRIDGMPARPLYIIVEKILSKGEQLRHDWPVFGTTGYEFAGAVNGIFVNQKNARAFDRLYDAFTAADQDFPNLVNASKKMIMLVSLASEVNMLGYQLKRLSAQNRWYRDFTLNSLTFALREIIACLAVYRTYIVDSEEGVDRQDRVRIEAAIAEAKRRNPRTAASVFDFIADILLRRYPPNTTDQEKRERDTFVMKFQQTTGPVMAKGVEDTALYVYNRLTSLNEVGSSPEQFGTSVAAFHRLNLERHRLSPNTLNCTSTHDTKRSEDVRARIDVLSEMPREWKAAIDRWHKMNIGKKSIVDNRLAPDENEEYLLYQTLLGAWPFEPMDLAARESFLVRMQRYALKAIKEAKVNTSWINPNEQYDNAVLAFVSGILEDVPDNPFLPDFANLQHRVSHFGVFSSLAQTLLKIACPGVPDFYQGTEIWDLSLVDPDNRRPVDFGQRIRLLRALERRVAKLGDGPALARWLLDHKENSLVKLHVIVRGLHYRRENAGLFRHGSYIPLVGGGTRAQHVCAFARLYHRQEAIVAVPRLVLGLTGGALVSPVGPEIWADSWLAITRSVRAKSFHNLLTGEVVQAERAARRYVLPLSQVFASFPLALLIPEER